jgi:hypothetical protein
MKPVVIRVTQTVDYLIEVDDINKHTNINGWSIEEVIDDWFKNPHALSSYHAAREYYRIGNNTRFVDAKILSVDDITKEIKSEEKSDKENL